MPSRKPIMMMAFAAVLALMLTMGPSTQTGLAASPAVRVDIVASQSGDTTTYKITVVNTSSEPVGRLFIAGAVPTGATFVKAVDTPKGTWFRGFEGARTDLQAAVWLGESIPANGQLGPFSYQVKAATNLAPAHAWVRWLSPSEGAARSSGIAVTGVSASAAGYVGSDACAKCHASKYNDFKVSGHPWKLRPAAEAKNNPLPLPAGVTWDDVSYVIGGYKWKSRYIDNQGYIMTSAAGQPGKNQYNLANGKWSDYEAGKQKKYDCGACHTTGYSKEGNQDGMPGVVGTWAFPGIQCEACHGPGAKHIAGGGDKSAIKVDRSAALCGTCHIRNAADTIPASGGFIQHHEQYNEMLAGPHKAQGCVTCHDPHKKAELSIKTQCSSCHSGVAQAFTGSSMQKVGVTCVDCHMPTATKSAVAISKNEADVKTHIFRINPDPKANMFTDDGLFAKDFLTLNFACLACHQDKDANWAASKAKGIHSLGN